MGRKSTLTTPDPFHVPGYNGYVPQFKYTLGETFGSHTHKLLTDKTIAASPNSVLANNEVQQQSLPPKTQAEFFSSPVYDTYTCLGNQKYMPQMIPGYTGYIPKALHNFGNRYAESCHYAISAFKNDQRKYDNKMAEMSTTNHIQSSSVTGPLTPIANKAKVYLPMFTKQHSISPYYMPNGHPLKYFVSGYTGFVPKQQKYIGQGYPIITRHALQDHAHSVQQLDQSLATPVIIDRPLQPIKPTPLLYKKGQGLLPRYTGHVQGQRYKFGMTFGTSTNRAVSEIAS